MTTPIKLVFWGQGMFGPPPLPFLGLDGSVRLTTISQGLLAKPASYCAMQTSKTLLHLNIYPPSLIPPRSLAKQTSPSQPFLTLQQPQGVI